MFIWKWSSSRTMRRLLGDEYISSVLNGKPFFVTKNADISQEDKKKSGGKPSRLHLELGLHKSNDELLKAKIWSRSYLVFTWKDAAGGKNQKLIRSTTELYEPCFIGEETFFSLS